MIKNFRQFENLIIELLTDDGDYNYDFIIEKVCGTLTIQADFSGTVNNKIKTIMLIAEVLDDELEDNIIDEYTYHQDILFEYFKSNFEKFEFWEY